MFIDLIDVVKSTATVEIDGNHEHVYYLTKGLQHNVKKNSKPKGLVLITRKTIEKQLQAK